MKPLSKDDKAGLYLTVIVHLAVLIVLLIAGLGASLRSESSFVMDFSQLEDMERMQEEIKRLQEEISFKEAISRKLQGEIASAPAASVPRGVAVDRASLKDDRGTDAKELYKDAARLQEELNKAAHAQQSDDYADPQTKKTETKAQESSYSGPSVVSYDLGGRKASHLPIPAYRCLGAGEVTVIITVNPSGTVINAKVDELNSSTDGCLRSFAVRAARLSKFSAQSDASPKQVGNIVYSFVAQ